MKLTRTAGAISAVAALAVAGCATSTQGSSSDSGGSSNGPVTLRFESLAFQDPTIKATKDIVAAWNQAHPDVQVKYVQGSWDSVQDQLVTQFQGGTAPDIIQYESAAMSQFAQQGYLADLTDTLSPDVKSAVSPGVWKTVTVDGKIIAAPTLLQSYMVFANKDLLKQAGVQMPTGDTWSWDDFQAAAKATTKSGVYGVGWGLSEPTATMMSLGLNFGASYFTGTGNNAKAHVGSAEMALPERIHQMAYDDKSIAPVTLTQSGSDTMTGFLKGKYAMTVQGSYIAQTLSQTAPKSLHWMVMPPLAGTSANQSADPQTLSVSAQSSDVADSTAFINYYMQAQNLSKVAEGDWLIPASSSAADQVTSDTGGKNGWSTILASGKDLVAAPYQFATNYPQWKDQIATPAFQQYLGNQISSADLVKKLTDGWDSVNQ
jgi:multiple sugar transport system substrate-binding protein